MAKVRKTLGSWDTPCCRELMALIESQSKPTIIGWCLDWARENTLPIAGQRGDPRPAAALDAAQAWLDGAVKLPQAKPVILALHAYARECGEEPAIQAAARAIGQACSTIHSPSHSLGLLFYGAAALAYSTVGLGQNAAIYESVFEQTCLGLTDALRAVAVPDEPDPVAVTWRC